MSIDCHVVIARGYRFTTDMFENKDELKEVLAHHGDQIIYNSPMTSSPFIFGQELFSSGSVYEDGDFDIQLDTVLKELSEEHGVRSDFENFQLMPKLLTDTMIRESIEPHTHIFTRFS